MREQHGIKTMKNRHYGENNCLPNGVNLNGTKHSDCIRKQIVMKSYIDNDVHDMKSTSVRNNYIKNNFHENKNVINKYFYFSSIIVNLNISYENNVK